MIGGLKINEDLKRLYYERGYWGDETLADAWNRAVERYSEHVYVKDDHGGCLTYGQVDERASRLATWLVEAGVGAGDVVTFQMPKWTEFCIVYVACLKVGAVMHPLSIRAGEGDIAYNVNKARSAVFICPTAYGAARPEDALMRLRGELPTLRAFLFVDREAPSRHLGAPVLGEVLATREPYSAGAGSKPDDVACLLTTSGTTGPAKIAMLTHNAILFSERSYIGALGIACDDVMWMASPLDHATGFFHGLVSAMFAGSSTVLQQEYSPTGAVELINRESCTWSHGATPFIYDLLCELDGTDSRVPSLKLFLCGGAPVPSALVRHAREHGILLCESYGSTESCPHAYVPPDQCTAWDGAFSGVPYEGIEIRIVDAHRNQVAPGMQGEEASRGPHMFAGYLGDRALTDQALDDDGWFYSGDLGFLDEQGRLRINGRKKEIIIRGGENLSAHEIDEHLTGCPGIGAHATIGMPDERLGERICTFAVPMGRPTDLESVLSYLAQQKVPKRFWPERLEFIDQIPHTGTGKVKRYVLARELLRRMGDRTAS